MRALLVFLMILLAGPASAQLIGRKKENIYLYQYDPKTRDGFLLFEIDVKMVDVIHSITISNRKRFRKRSATVNVSENDYRYVGRSGFTVRANLCKLKYIIGRFSDTATVDIKIQTAGEGYTWEKSILLDKRELVKSQYIEFK